MSVNSSWSGHIPRQHTSATVTGSWPGVSTNAAAIILQPPSVEPEPDGPCSEFSADPLAAATCLWCGFVERDHPAAQRALLEELRRRLDER